MNEHFAREQGYPSEFFTIEEKGGQLIVALKIENLDTKNARKYFFTFKQHLEQLIESKKPTELIIDLKDFHIDDTTIGVLHSAFRKTKEQGGKFIVRGLLKEVKDQLQRLGIIKYCWNS